MLANINLFIVFFINGTPLIGPHYLVIKALQRSVNIQNLQQVVLHNKMEVQIQMRTYTAVCDQHM